MSKLNQYDYDRDDFYYDDNDDMGEDESYEETELNEVLEEDNEEQLEKSRRNPEAEKNINECARRWSDLNHEIKNGNNSASKLKERKTLGDKICIDVFNLYKKSYADVNDTCKGKYRNDVIKLNKKGAEIFADKFYDFLFSTMNADSKSCYDANKNDTYLAYIRTILELRSKEVKTDNVEFVEIQDYERSYGKDSKGKSPVQISEDYEDSIRQEKNRVIEFLITFMKLFETKVRNSVNADKSISKTFMVFRMIFTFDIVNAIEAIKKYNIPLSKLRRTEDNPHENITPEELELYCQSDEEFAFFKKRNYEIYRNMRLALVELLKEGNSEDFKDMLDIIRRCLREGVSLEKRQEYVAEGLAKDNEYSKEKVSRTTISKYVGLYMEAVKDVLNSGQLYY